MNTIDRRPQFKSEEDAKPSDDQELDPVEGEEDEDELVVPDEEEETSPDDSPSKDEPEEEEEPEEEGEDPEEGSDPDPEPEEEDELSKEAKALEAIKAQKAALLGEISDLRKERREIKTTHGHAVPPKKEEPIMVDDELKDIDPQSIEVVEKVLRARGYVKKDELEQRDKRTALTMEQNAWLDEHPEYKAENDPNDERWNKLTEIVALFQVPSNTKQLRKILDIAHGQIAGSSPRIAVKPKGEVQAKREKLKASATPQGGSGAKTVHPSKKSNIDPSYLVGFTDEEKAEILG